MIVPQDDWPSGWPQGDMKMGGIRSRAVGLVAGALLVLPAPVVAQAVVITNASIVDASAAVPVRVGSIVIEDGRITAIGTSVPVAAGALAVDARDKFVVPGLWDMHAHLAALTPVGRAPEQYVGHGVLNIRDMGGKTGLLLPLRAAIRGGARARSNTSRRSLRTSSQTRRSYRTGSVRQHCQPAEWLPGRLDFCCHESQPHVLRSNAGRLRSPELGRVMVGAPASFIILDGNPLLDIKNLRAISAVVLRKQFLDATELAKLRR